MSRAAILVVEDNEITRKMMRLALQAEGYTVLEAEDGKTALRLVAEQTPGLVLLDCKLPDMDGFEVARRIRTLAPKLPVVAVTGWAQADESSVIAAGFLDFLVKPVEPSRLIEVVALHLGDGPGRSAGAGKLVLLVDDDSVSRKLARLVLSSVGFEVAEAGDCEHALRLARERKPDAIVSDVLMPETDGFALCKAVRDDITLASVPIVLMSAHFLESEDRALAVRFGASRYVTRTGGFEGVVRAVLDVIGAPATALPRTPSADLQTEHSRRIAHQLDRQTSIGVGLARRVSLQASALSVLDSLSDSLARQLAPESALDETLARCLDAAGVSVGAILLSTASGDFSIKAQVGSQVSVRWQSFSPLLVGAMGRGSLMLPSEEGGDSGDHLLTALGAASAVIVPIIARDEAFGALLLASNGTDLAGADGESAVRAARAVSMQLGQALALSRMVLKLMSTEQRYRALLEHAQDAISITTPDGILLEVNRQTEKMLGRSREQLLGHAMVDFAGNHGSGANVPVAIARPNGSVVQIEFSSTVVEVGGERYVLNIGRDVSDRLRLEAQLLQSQKMEAVGRLAGGIAHDFNNLLSVILSYGDLLLTDLKPGEPMRNDVEEIRKAASRAAGLTRQLLMFSRQQVFEPKVIDLNVLLVSMDNMLQRILGADVDLVALCGQGLGSVRADRGGIEQVIMNLVVNARDAMPTGGMLTLETANVELDDDFAREHHGVEPGRHVMLAVTDTGMGMDKATLARIYEPFFTTKEQGKGTGLGLATVFGIVRQSGGNIWVYSEPAKGTTFKVYLPRVDDSVDAVQMVERPGTLRGSETILLVEDDEQVRAVARQILRKSGYQVIEACNAGEALMRSEQHRDVIHLLLSDVVMPQISGPALAKRLAEGRTEMKVLFMSGYTDDSIVRHGVLDSHFAYLQKPITPNGLTMKVREVLDRAHVLPN